MMMSVLDNQPGAARDIVALNAGVALYAGNVTATMAEGVTRAQAVIASGQAKAKMQALVAFSKTFPVPGA